MKIQAWVVTFDIENETYALQGYMNEGDAKAAVQAINERSGHVGSDVTAVAYEVEITSGPPDLEKLYTDTGLGEDWSDQNEYDQDEYDSPEGQAALDQKYGIKRELGR